MSQHLHPVETAVKGRILFQLTGSIACFKACAVISKLVQAGYDVQTVATPSALEFVGRATLEGLTGRPTFTEVFELGRTMDHIHHSKWADLAIVCPSTASTLNKLAAGIADDVIGALFLSYDLVQKPFLVVPAMNQQMFQHPATQRSISMLEEWNVKVLKTAVGHQACGDHGPGRLLEPEQIYDEIVLSLGKEV